MDDFFLSTLGYFPAKAVIPPYLHSNFYLAQSAPHSLIFTSTEVAPLWLPKLSIFFTTSRPFVTFPNTVCLPSSQGLPNKYIFVDEERNQRIRNLQDTWKMITEYMINLRVSSANEEL